MKINLEELAKALAQSDIRQGYVDIEKGRVIQLDDEMGEEDALEHIFTIEDDWEHYIPLPNVIDRALHGFMQGFAESCAHEETKKRLIEALQGNGAFARFNHQVRYLLLKPAWERYLHECLRAAARDWCEENALEYDIRS